MSKNKRRFVWVQGELREVRRGWLWLFRLLHIGYDLSPGAVALAEVIMAADLYHRKCEAYLQRKEGSNGPAY